MMTASLTGARILVADDDPHVRQLLVDFFEDQGCAVKCAGDGARALLLARSWRPDAIVIDLLMPQMNGWQFADAYAASLGEHAPIVAITASGPAAVRSATQLGRIATVLSKPLDLDELGLIVRMHLGNSARMYGT